MKRAKFKAGQVVRIVALLDLGRPYYARIVGAPKDGFYWLERIDSDRHEGFKRAEKHLRALSARELGEEK